MTRPDVPFSPELLSAYLDDECDDGERSAVESALRADPRWRRELDEVRTARSALRGSPLPQLSPDALEAIIATVAAADDPAGSARISRRGSGRVHRMLAGSAAAVAVAAALVAVVVMPARTAVKPPVASMVDSHAGSAMVGGQPIARLAPIAMPAGLRR